MVDAMPEAFFSSVIDAAPDGMLIVDGSGTITFANRQAVELFGITHDDLLGSSVDRLLPDDVRATHRAHRLRFRAEPSVRPMGVGMLLRARRGDGTEFPVEVSLSPLHDAEAFHVVVAVRDVTARVEADDQMHRVLHTLDATDEAVFIMDAETLQLSYVNDGASRQLGYPKDDLIGMTPMHINPELSEAELHALVDEVRAVDRTAVSIRTTHRRRDGTDVPVEMSLRASPHTNDAEVSIIAVARDISARLAAEEQLRRSEDALREAEQVLAISDDRERIARDLHDVVIQRLFATGMELQSTVPHTTRTEVAKRINHAVDALDETIRDIRRSIFELRTPVGVSLRTELHDIVEAAAGVLGFRPALDTSGPVDSAVPDDIIPEILAVVREALTNVTRHAKANAVRVSVRAADGQLAVVVQDDGVGADASLARGGLVNLLDRAADLGGTFEVRGGEGGGTVLAWRVPLTG